MKELRSSDVVEILSGSFGFNKVSTNIGQGVRLSPYDAFIFSLITGAGYLENKIFPYTPKGHFKIFQHALSFKMVTGLFENYSFRTTPYYLNQTRPFLFKGEKTIIPVEFETEKELYSKLNLICEHSNPEIIILRVETYKKGNGMEPFLEYLACMYFNKLGYITENQIPLFPTVGSPDFGGFNFAKEILFEGGFNVVELSLIRLFPQKISSIHLKQRLHLIVGEAKTSSRSLSSQLNKYLNTGLFNEGIEIMTQKNKSTTRSSFYLNENNEVVYEQKKDQCVVDPHSQEIYYKWLKKYLSLYILSNLSNDEMFEFYHYKMNQKIEAGEDILKLVELSEPNLFILEILNFIENGSFK